MLIDRGANGGIAGREMIGYDHYMELLNSEAAGYDTDTTEEMSDESTSGESYGEPDFP